MKLLIALVCSCFLHLAWMFFWPLHLRDLPNINTASNLAKPLELNITHQQFNHVESSFILKKNKISKKLTNQIQPHQHTLTQNIISQITPAEPQKEISEVYLSIKEVDIQALPIGNIDASRLPAAMQHAQIKLRLFIDEFGKIVRIEPIKSQLYQDETLETALSNRLTEIHFTPAKRGGLDVKSYQDVAYDFNYYQASSP